MSAPPAALDVMAIFNGALEQPSASARAAYLDRACGGDTAIRARVETLLEAYDRVGGFLESPAQPPTIDVDQPPPEQPGTTIGPYKLLEQVGEGGMGVVFVAEQTEPIRRRVALKVIKPGMDTRQVIARFEAERQALAMMDHPNIARVLDAGTTEAGRPYFVMELVRGMPITEYCDKARLSPRGRLELFVDVCQAVKHAHQKGIIHRDLKPSNVLITLHDGTPVVKVIDFGVAKAVGQQLTERTLYTGLTQLVGTPLYMSPEQAEMSGLDVDTRSDVYSLGVLLYELLTGQTPFDRETLARAGLDELRRIIREDDPLRPSRRFSSLGAQASSTISQHRGLDERRLSKILCGELDWIVMKSLAKDRGRRYESASAFATDVQRYLDDEPVLAGPPSTMYKFHKFARKHRAALATAVAIAASLILGTTASAWQAVRATTAEAQANANAVKAQEKAQEATTQRDEVQALNEKLAAKEQQLQRTLYAAHMNLARQAWEEIRIPRMVDLLERHRPKPGEPDLRGFEWHYLYRLSHFELLTLKGHTGGISCVAYSPDGKRLASASQDQTVKVWDAQTGQELLSIKHAYQVSDVAFSPDGQRLASAGHNMGQMVKVSDAQTGQELFSLKVPSADSVAFSPDGKRLAYSSNPWDDTKNDWGAAEVKVCDAQTGQELLTCKGHTSYIGSVAFSPDGKRLASASVDGTAKVWDGQTGQELLSLKGHHSAVQSVAFSPDGKRLASGEDHASSEDHGTVKVWDAQTGQELLTLKGHRSGGPVAFSPDGKRVASGSYHNTVTVWDAQTGQVLCTFKGVGGCVVFSPDGKRLASANYGKTVQVWDAQQEQERLTFKGHAGEVFGVAYSPDGKRLASASGDKTVKVWDVQTGQQTLTIEGHTVPVWTVVFSPDGKRLASGSGTDQLGSALRDPAELKVWDAQTGQELFTLLKGVTGSFWSVAFSPDGKRLAGAYASPLPRQEGRPALTGTVKVWDAQTGQELLLIKEESFWHAALAFSPDGKRLVSMGGGAPGRGGTGPMGGKVWDAQTGQELFTFNAGGFLPGGTNAAFSADGKRLTGVSPVRERNPVTDNRIVELKVWDAQTGQELPTLQGGHSRVALGPGNRRGPRLALSPDGRRLASAHGETLKVWDTQTGEELLTLKVPTEGVGSVFFSPDGHRLAGGGGEGTIWMWDATPLPETP